MALLHMTFASDVLMQNVDVDVILPEDTPGLIGMGGKASDTYPTLYLLHGMSDDHTIWQRRTSIERYVSDLNLAVVMPSIDLSWYTDMYYGYKYWTFMTEELPRTMRAFFPRMSDKREDTFVAGLSMGGYGALKCGLRAPEVFSYAAGLSSGTDPEALIKEAELGDDTYWTDVFGPANKFPKSFNDLFAACKDLKKNKKHKVRFYMWCGTEDFLYKQNIKMRDHMKKVGLDLTYEESPGDHSWAHWDEKIQTILEWLPLKKEVE